jgi:hypothetical protein
MTTERSTRRHLWVASTLGLSAPADNQGWLTKVVGKPAGIDLRLLKYASAKGNGSGHDFPFGEAELFSWLTPNFLIRHQQPGVG